MSFDDEEEERALKEFDGLRPDELVGADESQCGPERAEQTPQEQDDESTPHDCEFSPEDEFHDAFPVEPIQMGMHKDDGMPVPIDGNMADAFAVPFTYETQLCVEDARKYVELFTDELPEIPLRRGYPVVNRERYSADGTEKPRREYMVDDVEVRFGVPCILAESKLVFVRPIRPKCKHFKRQVFNSRLGMPEGEFGHQEVFRVCTARRSNGGAHMSLRDQGIYQCDFRDPPCPKTTKAQDEKDLVKLRTRPDKEMVPAFGVGGDSYRKD